MTRINEYRVEFADNSGIIGSEKRFEKNVRNILAQNDRYLCIDNYGFSTIEKKGIGKPSISIYNNDRIWGNRVTLTLYSYKNVRPSTIRSHIERRIKKKFGFFQDRIDLSFIK